MSELRLERRLQITLACMVALGTLLLGMGQRDVILPLVALIASATSVYFTDIKGWLRVNRIVANVAALAAVAFSVSDFFRLDSGLQLLAIANLLIYLQVILLYQSKNTRLYWQIMMLSLLQVVVGAALNLNLMFGVLLLAYMLLALLAVHLMFVRTELSRLRRITEGGPGPSWAMVEPPGLGEPTRRDARQPELLRLVRGRLLARNMFQMMAFTLLVTAVMFFVVPRTGRAVWRPGTMSFARTVGFSDKVDLGSFGEISENPEAVMRVQFRHPDTDKPMQLTNDPLLRGTVLTAYERGQWKDTQRRRWSRWPRRDSPPAVTQNIVIEPMDHDILFSVYPFLRSGTIGDRLPIRRRSIDQRARIEYSVKTLGIRDGRQADLNPNTEFYHPTRTSSSDIDELKRTASDADGIDPHAGLKAIAAAWIADSGAATSAGKARTLSNRLQAPPFEYSLKAQQRDPDLDPIEDFITNNPRGHCEYYASALTLMLRSQGIPARMIVGYRGGEWNSLGEFYQVRQLHAHTWVEAYLYPDEVDDTLNPHGAWLTLDPTPAGPDVNVSEGGLFSTLGQFSDYLKAMWAMYVVGMNSERQNESIYEPLQRWLEGTFDIVTDSERRHQVFAQLAKFLGLVGQTEDTDRFGFWLIKLIVILLAVLAAALYVLRWLLRLAIWLVVHLRSQAKTKRGGAFSTPVEFYERFEKLLARHGMLRPAAQTQHEFALAVSGQLAERPQDRAAAVLPRRIADAFYRVRFGGHALDNVAASEVEHALSQLAATLAAKRRT